MWWNIYEVTDNISERRLRHPECFEELSINILNVIANAINLVKSGYRRWVGVCVFSFFKSSETG
jgi:hypothetical protein